MDSDVKEIVDALESADACLVNLTEHSEAVDSCIEAARASINAARVILLKEHA